MRPVVSGMCLYESLLDGSVGMEDLCRMNDALDVEDENRARGTAAAQHSGTRK